MRQKYINCLRGERTLYLQRKTQPTTEEAYKDYKYGHVVLVVIFLFAMLLVGHCCLYIP